MTRNNPRREAALRLVETSRLLRAVVEHRLKPFGMTRAQFSTLSRLDRQDGQSQNEVAEALEMQPIAMVRLVDQLSAEGLVERRNDPNDRRVNRLHITGEGRNRVRVMDGFKETMGEELFAGFGEADILGVLEAFDRLHANLKTMQAADAAANRIKKSGT